MKNTDSKPQANEVASKKKKQKKELTREEYNYIRADPKFKYKPLIEFRGD